MKKLIGVCLTLVICLNLVSPIYAVEAESVTEEEMDLALLERGYPQAYLENTSETAKEELYYNEDLSFLGATVTTYDESLNEYTNYEIANNGITTYGQIPKADLTLSFSVNRSAANRDKIYVIYSYDWIQFPFFRWQDPIGVSWDPDKFELSTEENSFHKIDKYDGTNINGDGMVGESFTGRIHSEEFAYASGSSAGVSWYADLYGQWPTTILTRLYGSASFYLDIVGPASGTSKLYGQYTHLTVEVTATMDIPRFGNFSMSIPSGYDELGNSIGFSY